MTTDPTHETMGPVSGKAAPLQEGFASLLGQEQSKNLLLRLFNQGKQHAILFTGPPGSGRHSLARAYARMLLCEDPKENDACGKCRSCSYIAKGIHPDYAEINKGEEKGIKVDQVRRGVVSDLAMAPQISSRKVYLIDGDDLNEQGQNALLKSLEEPPPYAVFLLTVSSRERLLATIHSRAAEVKTAPLEGEDMEAVLKANGIEEQAEFLAHYAQGNPGKAIALATEDSVIRLREEVISLLEKLPDENPLTLMSAPFQWLKEEKDAFPLILNLFQRALRDLALVEEGAVESLVNLDHLERYRTCLRKIKNTSKEAELAARFSAAERHCREMRRALEANVNIEILSWQFLMKLQEYLMDKA